MPAAIPIAMGVMAAAAVGGTVYTIKNSNDQRAEAEQQAQDQATQQQQAEAKMEQQQQANQAQSVAAALSGKRASQGAVAEGYGGTLLGGTTATPGSGAAASSGQKTLLGM